MHTSFFVYFGMLTSTYLGVMPTLRRLPGLVSPGEGGCVVGVT